MKKFFSIIFKPFIDLEENKINFKESGFLSCILLTILFFIFLVIYEIPESIPISAIILFKNTNNLPFEIVACILAFIFTLLLALTLGSLFGKETSLNITKNKLNKSNILFTLITTFSVMLILHGSLIPLSSLLPTNPYIEESFETLNQFNIYALFSTCILAPLKEEYFFRGILYKKMSAKYKPWTAIILSAILFGLIHANFQQFFVAVPLGILFAYIYKETKSIYLCIFGHFLNNAFTGFLFISTTNLTIQIVLSIVYIIIGILLLNLAKNKFIIKNNSNMEINS